MSAAVLNLTARKHESRVLNAWLARRGARAVERAYGGPEAAATAAEVKAAVTWGGISWDDWVRGNVDGVAGVTEKSARAVAAVSACVNLIGGSIASMPLHLYRRGADGDREAYKDPLWWLLNERAYAGWSGSAMWEYVIASRLLHGDAFVRIHRGGPGGALAVGFEPIHPTRVQVKRVMGDLLYAIAPDPALDRFSTADHKALPVHPDDMLHITGPGFDGLRSLSQLQYGLRNAAGIAVAADEQSAQFMADGARPDFAIEIPGDMKDEAREHLRQSWVSRHTGQGAKKAPVVLAGGMKLHQLTMSAEDSQLITTRGFQVEEICRVFGVPPFMIGHTEKTTSWGSGVEQMSIGFVKYTLQRHLVAIEQEINHKLFKTSRNFCEFVTAGLERGDLKGRFEAYRIALGRAGEPAWISANEIRRLENMPADPAFENQMPAQQQAEPTTP